MWDDSAYVRAGDADAVLASLREQPARPDANSFPILLVDRTMAARIASLSSTVFQTPHGERGLRRGGGHRPDSPPMVRKAKLERQASKGDAENDEHTVVYRQSHRRRKAVSMGLSNPTGETRRNCRLARFRRGVVEAERVLTHVKDGLGHYLRTLRP